MRRLRPPTSRRLRHKLSQRQRLKRKLKPKPKPKPKPRLRNRARSLKIQWPKLRPMLPRPWIWAAIAPM
ncbi:hypothetical protein DDE20_14795 [Pararhodobacter oceanensis]|uniref:Uncharacterized protein n=1 Tax=Pararhodobacter oceanensis TaxID=2172121 RepID=A0A2T8HRV1_9RHOB|nr:hypothetical protein DDE20_14795 [Pararhodobacter oceanensis]